MSLLDPHRVAEPDDPDLASILRNAHNEVTEIQMPHADSRAGKIAGELQGRFKGGAIVQLLAASSSGAWMSL